MVKGFAWLMSLVAAFVLGAVKSDTTREGVCQYLPAKWPSVVKIACPKESQQVTDGEAILAIDHYLGRTSGATPQDEWSSLTPNAQQNWSSLTAFQHSFDGILWYERIGPVLRVKDPGTFNRFSVEYYEFRGTVNEKPNTEVNVFKQVFQLARTGTVTEIADVAPVSRLNTYTDWVYPRVQTFRSDPTFRMRQFSGPSRLLTYGGDPTLAHGGWLVPFCRIKMPDGAWIRSATGWTPDEFLENGNRDLAGMMWCDRHYGDIRGGPAISPNDAAQTHPVGQ